jgi:hypothetical protein
MHLSDTSVLSCYNNENAFVIIKMKEQANGKAEKTQGASQ